MLLEKRLRNRRQRPPRNASKIDVFWLRLRIPARMVPVPCYETLSSSGLGHSPFTGVTRVRIPLGSPLQAPPPEGSTPKFGVYGVYAKVWGGLGCWLRFDSGG